MADLARGVAVGYRARPRFPLSGADPRRWFEAAQEHGLHGRLAASLLATTLERREDLPANSVLITELDAAVLASPEVQGLLNASDDLSRVVIELVTGPGHPAAAELRDALAPARERGGLLWLRASGPGHLDAGGLVSLDPDFVSVDGGLVGDIDAAPRRAAALAALGALAGELDAWLVADGVRKTGELTRLAELRVPLVAGALVGGEREVMMGLEPAVRSALCTGTAADRVDDLSPLSTPIRTVAVAPELCAHPVVVVDRAGRPREVVLPGPGRRPSRHPALCVQREDRPVDVARRAAARPADDELVPVCLCDDTGALLGVIGVTRLLGVLAGR